MMTNIPSSIGKAMFAVALLLFTAKLAGGEPQPAPLPPQPGVSLNTFRIKEPAGESDYWRGQACESGGDLSEAVKCYRKAAEQGHEGAREAIEMLVEY